MGAGVALGAALLGGIMNKRAADKQAKADRALAEENARLMEAEAAETARRLEAQQEENLSRAQALKSASGTTGTGSQERYMGRMQEEFSQELAWVKKSGASQAALERRRGASQAKAGKRAGWAGLVGSVGGGLSQYSAAGGTWGWED